MKLNIVIAMVCAFIAMAIVVGNAPSLFGVMIITTGAVAFVALTAGGVFGGLTLLDGVMWLFRRKSKAPIDVTPSDKAEA